MDNISTSLKNFFLELFFPSFCFGCNKEGTLLCYDCKSTLEISEYHYCLCNNHPLRLPPGSSGTCNRCKYKKLSGLYSALPYKEKSLTRTLIHNFKYEPYIKTLSTYLTDLILEHLLLSQITAEHIGKDSIIIPIPLEMKKRKSRGYNQSQELATLIGQAFNVPSIPDNLVKIKKTPPQMKLSLKEREENIKNVFAVKNPAQVKGKKVFLVDDVYTTGSTMEECARILKEAGAKTVWGMVVAREG